MTIRSGPWLVARGPVSLQLHLSAFFSALESDELASSVFPDDPRVQSPHVNGFEPRLVVYNIASVLDADLAAREQLASNVAGSTELNESYGSPFCEPLADWSFLNPDPLETIYTLQDFIQESIEPQSWDSRSGPYWSNSVGSRVVTNQLLRTHDQLTTFWQYVAMPDGLPHRSWSTDSGVQVYWAVYDTMPLWSAAFALVAPETTLEDAAWNFDRGWRTLWEEHILWPDGSPPDLSDPPLFMSLPGRLALLGTKSQHARFVDWLDDAAQSELIVGVLVEPDEHW